MSFNKYTFSSSFNATQPQGPQEPQEPQAPQAPQEPQPDPTVQSCTFPWIDSGHIQQASRPVNFEKEQLTLLRLGRSDGAFVSPEDGVNKFGSNVYYFPIGPNSPDDISHRKQVAEKLAGLLELQKLPSTAGFILYEWPPGFAPYHKVVSDIPRSEINPEHPRRTRYKHVDFVLFGHPKGIAYDKKADLGQHFKWLARGDQDCKCGKCSRMKTNPRLI